MKSSIMTLSSFLLAYGLKEPNGKYCGDVIGNEIDITFYTNKDKSDISATIFGSHYQCNNENIVIIQIIKKYICQLNLNDCLNKVLENMICVHVHLILNMMTLIIS